MRLATEHGIDPSESRIMAFTAHSLQLDRLIVAARTLDEGARHVSDAVGVAPLAEIRDLDMRTHSRVLPLAGGPPSQSHRVGSGRSTERGACATSAMVRAGPAGLPAAP